MWDADEVSVEPCSCVVEQDSRFPEQKPPVLLSTMPRSREGSAHASLDTERGDPFSSTALIYSHGSSDIMARQLGRKQAKKCDKSLRLLLGSYRCREVCCSCFIIAIWYYICVNTALCIGLCVYLFRRKSTRHSTGFPSLLPHAHLSR